MGVKAEYYQQTAMAPIHFDTNVDCFQACANIRYGSQRNVDRNVFDKPRYITNHYLSLVY